MSARTGPTVAQYEKLKARVKVMRARLQFLAHELDTLPDYVDEVRGDLLLYTATEDNADLREILARLHLQTDNCATALDNIFVTTPDEPWRGGGD